VDEVAGLTDKKSPPRGWQAEKNDEKENLDTSRQNFDETGGVRGIVL
jgi:hypothetical protein